MMRIINGFKMIFEGRTLKDKLFISEYFFLRFPVHFLMRKLGIKKINNNLRKNITLKNKEGVFFCGKNIFSVFTCSSVYEKEITNELKKFGGGFFIDVGANVGRYPVILGNHLKDKVKIIAIEPLKENVKIIKKSLFLNSLKNVITVQVACGNINKKLNFYLDSTGAGGGGSSLVKSQKRKTKMEVKKLDSILNVLKIREKVDLIKIDVEGAESLVLKGALKTLKNSHPKIIFEAWDKNHLDKVKEILEPLKYNIKQIDEINYLAI